MPEPRCGDSSSRASSLRRFELLSTSRELRRFEAQCVPSSYTLTWPSFSHESFLSEMKL